MAGHPLAPGRAGCPHAPAKDLPSLPRMPNRRKVSMTRIGHPRSRMSAKVSCTVLKTSTSGDRRAEFNVRSVGYQPSPSWDLGNDRRSYAPDNLTIVWV